MFDSSTTNTPIEINLGYMSPKFVIKEEPVCNLSNGDYFELYNEIIDEIFASFSYITFNNMRTIRFYDVLLEEGQMQLTFRNLFIMK